MTSAARRRPALVVPDARSWAMWGHDLAEEGLEPVGDPAKAEVLAMPERVPQSLVRATAQAIASASPAEPVILGPAPGGARPAAAVVADPAAILDEDAAPSHEDAGARPAGHHHGDDDRCAGMSAQPAEGDAGGAPEPWQDNMMPIAGQPSRDGLVMEPIEFDHGPLAPGLPGGLVVSVSLDGDIVAACDVRATLHDPAHAGDPLAATAWRVATMLSRQAADVSGPARWLQVAAVELERALSHATWLSDLGRLLGWDELTRRAAALARPLVLARRATGAALSAHEPLNRARSAASRLQHLLCESRRLSSRTRARGTVDAADVLGAGITGPVARASGVAADARAEDPVYRALGFELRTRPDGDAHARTLIRLDEAVDALDLTSAAWERAAARAPVPDGPSPSAVEGPRGSVVVRRDAAASGEAGGREALSMAGRAAVGEEWASALVVIASFDLTPWRIGG